jgi:hypothetical protein
MYRRVWKSGFRFSCNAGKIYALHNIVMWETLMNVIYEPMFMS